MSAWKNEDINKMIELYPNVEIMEIFFASDTAIIENIYQMHEGAFRATVVNTYKNAKGAHENKNMIFILKRTDDNSNAFIISDSYGFCSWSQYPHYSFASKTGCLPDNNNYSDKEFHNQMLIARDLLFDTAKKLYSNLTDNIVIESTKISRNNDDTIRGEGVVINNSEYNLPELKYVIYFYDSNQKKIGTDSGWITKDNLQSGQKMKFNFHTKKVNGTKDASFELDFDLAQILDFVMNDNAYSGYEYEEFLRESQSRYEAV